MRSTHPRRGHVLVYTIISMLAMTGICSLAVDYGRVQAVKTDLARCADATARGSLVLYTTYDSSTAQTYGPLIASSTINPVDAGSGVSPTINIQWGTWNAATQTFTAGSYSSANAAVQVTASRKAANGNAVPLTWAAVLGRRTCDLSVTAVACLVGNATATYTVGAQADPWLAGMPAGSTASYNDTAPGQSPLAASSIPVTPGSYVTFTSVSGLVRHGPSLADDGPDGSTLYSHGVDSPGGPTPAAENGIADAVMPINALLGLFLDNNAPNTTAAPARRDYTSAASRDQSSYDDILLKQPFFVGDGKTSGAAVQQFRVPPGATRLYLGVMDGYEWNNNAGSFTVTVNQIQSVAMVK